MAELTLESLAAEVEKLKRLWDVATAGKKPLPDDTYEDLTPAMVRFLRESLEEQIRSGEPMGTTFAERHAEYCSNTIELPPDAASQIDHYLYGTPKR